MILMMQEFECICVLLIDWLELYFNGIWFMGDDADIWN